MAILPIETFLVATTKVINVFAILGMILISSLDDDCFFHQPAQQEGIAGLHLCLSGAAHLTIDAWKF